jgi:ribonuclease T2
MKINRKPLTH